MDNSKQTFKRFLDTVGIETFINYFEYFQKETENPKLFEIFELNEESWNKNAFAIKASSGKRLFRLGLEVDALKYIANEANPKRIGFDIQEKARLFLKEFTNVNTQQEIEIIDKSAQIADLSIIEKQILIKYRIGQSSFRRKLFEYWGGCSITGCANFSVLIASHIKQFSLCSSNEKYDLFNGLLLAPNYDKLFDEYLISFNEKGEILISDTLSLLDLQKLGVSKNDCIISEKLKQEHLIYLCEHRKLFREKN